MKVNSPCLGWIAGLAFAGLWAMPALAGQEIYLSVSPYNHYRVVVHQEIMRRIDNQIFFRYPIDLVDVRTGSRFKLQSGSAPFIQETPAGTFQVDWDLAHFDWDKDGRRLFFQLEVIEGLWRTYWVDIPRQKAVDITPILEAGLQEKFKNDTGCGTPKTKFLGWMKPDLAMFELDSICGKDKPIPNQEFSALGYRVLFDTKKDSVVSNCMNCSPKKSQAKFERYWKSTQVTPTPTPDQTPGDE